MLLGRSTNALAHRMKIQAFSGKQDSSIQVHPKTDWMYGIQLWGCTKPSNTNVLQRFQSNVLHSQCPMVCFEPHVTQRSSNSICHRRNKEIFHHISQLTNATQKQSCHRIKQPATCQMKTKMAVALRPHSGERRGVVACNSISYSVYRRIITGRSLQHIYLLLHCRVDCKSAK
jgi:hypothetical protein